MSLPTHQEVLDALDYDQSTGLFTWKRRMAARVMAGDVAGCVNSNGYIFIKLNQKTVYAHRLAWLYINGVSPTCIIDHIDGDKQNNKIANLRDVSYSINGQNQNPLRNTANGALGVVFLKSCGKWQAQIREGTRSIYLGRHLCKEDAVAAYIDAKKIVHPSAPDRRAT